MLSPFRALTQNIDKGSPLPKVPELGALYREGIDPRRGSLIMVVGRSGSQKSGFALFWTAKMNLKTLYFSADMSAFTASARLASMVTGDTMQQVEHTMHEGGEQADKYERALNELNVQFSFGQPITWRQVDEELGAWVELHNGYPEVIVFDNFMDFDGAEADYTAQMAVMQDLTALCRVTGSTVILMHHASDKSFDARSDPWSPPSRDQVKGGMSEKAELTLSVALDATTNMFKVSPIKQRSGRSDPTGRSYARLQCYPEVTRFGPIHESQYHFSGDGGLDAVSI